MRCRSLYAATGPRCNLQDGHAGPHTAEVLWSVGGLAPADDDAAATVKFPPIRETVHLRRPPPPAARLLEGAELLRALAVEIERDLTDRRTLPPWESDDPETCSAESSPTHDGITWVCGRERGHSGPHSVHGRTW